jgi:hypothetical protein
MVLARLALAVVPASVIVLTGSPLHANPGIEGVSYTDSANDIASGIATAGGTLDILGMEVSHTATDVIFSMTVNGLVSGDGSTDWGKFMVGIATGNGPSTTSGNGWGRPINMDAPNGGMNIWLGSWVDGGGGSEFRTYDGANWNLSGATYGGNYPGSYVFSGNTITWTISMAAMGVGMGDTFYFDAYSSGGGGGDGAIDALANPNASVQDWGDSYTSNVTNGIYAYTIPAPGALALLGLAGVAAGRRARKA